MIVKTPGSEQDVMVLTERLKVLALESQGVRETLHVEVEPF